MQKEIYSRLNQFFQKLEIFDLKLSKLEDDWKHLIEKLSKETQTNQKNLYESLPQQPYLLELSNNVSKEIQRIQYFIQTKNEEENIYKSKFDDEISKLYRLIEEIKQSKQQLEHFNQNISKDQIEKNRINVRKELNEIYKQTSQNRCVQTEFQQYIREQQSQSELGTHYKLKLEQKKIINQYCSGLIQVRGDGNCFYTAFGFQYLLILINKFDQNQYDQFINTIMSKVSFKIQYQNTQLEDEKIIGQLKDEFIYRLNFIRKIEDKDIRTDELIKQFKANQQEQEDLVDGCFFALSTIFFRNLSLYIIEQGEYKDSYQKNEFLTWELECNNNEIVIAQLAQFLNIHVIVFYVDQEYFKQMDYNKESQLQIILFLKPGHYNIGIPKQT